MRFLKMGSTPSRGSVKSVRQSRENSPEIVTSRPSSLYGSRPTSTQSKKGSRPNSLKSTCSTGAEPRSARAGSARGGSAHHPSPAAMYGRPPSTFCDLPGGVVSSEEQHQSPMQVEQMIAEIDRLRAELSGAELKADSFKEEAQELQELVLQKEDEICSLSLELEEMKEHGVQTQEERYQQTISAKDQYIRKLEEDLIKVKEDAAKECLTWEKKAKKARRVSATQRQDSALKLFELKDENAKLSEEKAKLQERLDRASIGGPHCRCGSLDSAQKVNDENSNDEDSKTQLILNLSQQVSALDQENSKLKKEVKDCRRTIEKLHKSRIREKHSTLSLTNESESLPSLGEFKTNSEKRAVNPVR